MKPKSSPLLLLTILAAVILVSGCTGLDPTTLAKSNSMIQQFLNEHPNAQIKVTHFTAEQAKNIIDQIRSDCDNPYLDEKEFYRVNITDPETNFFAIVWIDWSTNTVECVFKIGTEGKMVEKPKIKPACESHSYYKCDSGNLYWFDSCGNKQEKKEYCKYGCSEKACLGDCKSQAEYRCYGDHVFWFDSCGNKQEKKEYCQYGCNEGFCKTKPPYEKTCEEAGGYCMWPTAVAQSSAESGGQVPETGMVVAMEVTATSTRVTYQCREGYEIGNYFCKEGGICCIPKAAVPTEFCGSSTQGPCASDSECITGGCSGQVCQSVKEQSVPTTCEYKDCYNAEKYGMKCKCEIKSITSSTTAAIIGDSAVQGKCKWFKAEATQYCKDSDGGWNQYVRGTTATSSGISKTDECAQCTGACEPGTQCPPVYCGAAVEYACKEGEIRQETFLCPYGCKEGACLKEVVCRSEGEFCGGIAAIQCCSGLKCVLDGTYPDAGGTCVKGQACTDSDDGLNYNLYGETQLIRNGIPLPEKLMDHCLDSNQLVEYACGCLDSNQLVAYACAYSNSMNAINITYSCPKGCFNGYCNYVDDF